MTSLAARPRLLGEHDHAGALRSLMARLGLLFGLLFGGLMALDAGSDVLGDRLAWGLGIVLVAAYGGATGLLAYRSGRRQAVQLDFAPKLLREISLGVVLTDPEYRVVYANPAFARMLGRGVEQVVGTKTRDLVHPKDRAVLAREQVRRNSGESTTYRVRLWGDTPAPVEVVITASPFFDGDRFDGTIGLIQDVSETVLARREAADARTLSGFLFDAFTHDLSNSLQAVIGRSQVALALARAGSPAAASAIATAAANADRTAKLLREVKQIAMAERERWPQADTSVGAFVAAAIGESELEPLAVVVTDMPSGLADLGLEASEIGSLALSKLIEEAAAHRLPLDDLTQITVEVREGELGPTSVVFRVLGCPKELPYEEIELAMNPSTAENEDKLVWRSGVKLVLAGAVARPQGWKLHAYADPEGRGAVFELRLPSKGARRPGREAEALGSPAAEQDA